MYTVFDTTDRQSPKKGKSFESFKSAKKHLIEDHGVDWKKTYDVRRYKDCIHMKAMVDEREFAFAIQHDR